MDRVHTPAATDLEGCVLCVLDDSVSRRQSVDISRKSVRITAPVGTGYGTDPRINSLPCGLREEVESQRLQPPLTAEFDDTAS